MMDYGQNEADLYRIETRMDEPAAILDIKLFYLGNIVFIGLFTLYLTLSILAAAIAVAVAVVWYRRSFKAEKAGKPLLLRNWIIRIVRKLPETVSTGFFPSLYGTDFYEKYYRQ